MQGLGLVGRTGIQRARKARIESASKDPGFVFSITCLRNTYYILFIEKNTTFYNIKVFSPTLFIECMNSKPILEEKGPHAVRVEGARAPGSL